MLTVAWVPWHAHTSALLLAMTCRVISEVLAFASMWSVATRTKSVPVHFKSYWNRCVGIVPASTAATTKACKLSSSEAALRVAVPEKGM
jgi:hypothetical protein